MNKLLVICFSKDRPLQLCSYLDSLDFAFEKDQISPVVIYSASEPFEKAYDEVRRDKRIHECVFIEEMPHQTLKDSLQMVHTLPNEYVMFGCDDVIFTKRIDDSWRSYLMNEQVFAFSFRLGKNITYCHPADRHEAFSGTTIDDALLWRWPVDPGVDFAYAFELNATVYRREDISKYFRLIDGIDHWHPNIIEGNFHAPKIRSQFFNRPLMMSYLESHAYVITVNRVQNVAENRIYDEHSAEELLKAFYAGKQVDLNYYRDKTYNSIHIGELKLK